MKAEKYELKVFESVMNMVHGFYQDITEYYIPELNIGFNDAQGVNVFNAYPERLENRKNVEEIEISDDFAAKLKSFLDAKNEAEAMVKEFVRLDEIAASPRMLCQED